MRKSNYIQHLERQGEGRWTDGILTKKREAEKKKINGNPAQVELSSAMQRLSSLRTHSVMKVDVCLGVHFTRIHYINLMNTQRFFNHPFFVFYSSFPLFFLTLSLSPSLYCFCPEYQLNCLFSHVFFCHI